MVVTLWDTRAYIGVSDSSDILAIVEGVVN